MRLRDVGADKMETAFAEEMPPDWPPEHCCPPPLPKKPTRPGKLSLPCCVAAQTDERVPVLPLLATTLCMYSAIHSFFCVVAGRRSADRVLLLKDPTFPLLRDAHGTPRGLPPTQCEHEPEPRHHTTCTPPGALPWIRTPHLSSRHR